MRDNVLEYKGYHTKIEFDGENLKLRGKIEGISDLVNFEAADAESIAEEFRRAVDDYLEFCAEVGKEPEKEYKGTFNVRIDPKLHRSIAQLASKNGETLNHTVEKAIQAYVSGDSVTDAQQQYTFLIEAGALASENIYRPDYGNIRDRSKIIPVDSFKKQRLHLFYGREAEEN